jgi:hypothetical protein
MARLSRGVVTLEQRGRKRLLLGSSLVIAIAGLAFSWYPLLAAGLLVAAPLSISYARDRAFRTVRLRAAIRRHRDLSNLEPASQVLSKMGIDEQRIDDLLRRAKLETELPIAELDQNNRVVSDVGPIPLFENALIERDAFQKRSRNKVEIVIISNVVALKKSYRDFTSFRNEVIALDALKRLERVPKIVALDEQRQSLCQSFVPGPNLGTLMVTKGASVSNQYQAGRKYPGIDGWSRTPPTESERSSVLRAQSEVVDEAFIAALQKLFVAVHAEGVGMTDVKHGNVISYGGQPYFCDFDFARVQRSNDISFLLTRNRERDKFNYLFNGDLPTSSSLQAALAHLTTRSTGSELPSVYFGGGYSFGDLGGANDATALWLKLRTALLGSVGATVIDFGSRGGVIALELLRSGVERVCAYEPDSQLLTFARLTHQFFELVDNRAYDFRCEPFDRSQALARDAGGYDTALALDGLSGKREELEQLIAWLNENVQSLIIGCPNRVSSGAEVLATATAEEVRELLVGSKFLRSKQLAVPRGSLIAAATTKFNT